MDIAIIETQNGGDAVLNGNDFLWVDSNENNLYLGMFGGNVKEVTSERIDGVQQFDYWGNSLFHENEPLLQFNSETEKAFKEIPLTTSGRVLIENIIKKDLKFMSIFGVITVETAITATNRLEALITWIKPDGSSATVTLKFTIKEDGDFVLFDFNNDFNV